MGFTKDWNVDKMSQQIWSMTYEATNPRNDGFSTWPIKQDLYRLKWAIDDALEKCSEYSTEKEWLDAQILKRDQEKMWRILSENTNR